MIRGWVFEYGRLRFDGHVQALVLVFLVDAKTSLHLVVELTFIMPLTLLSQLRGPMGGL